MQLRWDCLGGFDVPHSMHCMHRSASCWLRRTWVFRGSPIANTPHRLIASLCGLSASLCTALGDPIVRSSHMYVGQDVQAGTIHRQVQPNLRMQPTAICFRRSALRAPIPLTPFALPSRPLHAAADAVDGTPCCEGAGLRRLR